MQANADFAPLLLRLLQCGSWALKRPLSPRRQAGGRATGAAWRRLLAPLLCFLSTCRISADNFLSVFRSSLRRAARRAAPLLFVSLGCCFFFFFLVHAFRFLSCRCDSSSALLPLARAASHAAQTPELPRAAAFTRAWNAKRNVTIQVTENVCDQAPLPLLPPPLPRPLSFLGFSAYRKLFQSVSDFLSTPAQRLRTDQPPTFCPYILSEDLVV